MSDCERFRFRHTTMRLEHAKLHMYARASIPREATIEITDGAIPKTCQVAIPPDNAISDWTLVTNIQSSALVYCGDNLEQHLQRWKT